MDLNYQHRSNSPRAALVKCGLGLWAAVLALITLPAQAGTLQLGPPVIQNNQYTFPVYLQGNSDNVAALDFRLAYDPAVFSPVSAQSGPAAISAQKQVSSNVAAPGEFIVVMMGFNQNVVQSGAVVELVLEKIGTPAGGQSELIIAEPTMATYEGIEIDSSGRARVVRFDEGKKDGDETTESPGENAGDNTEDPADAASPEAENGPNPGSRPVGSLPIVVADGGNAGSVMAGAASGSTENSAIGSTGVAATASSPAAASTDPLPPGAMPAETTGDASTRIIVPSTLPSGAGPVETSDPILSASNRDDATIGARTPDSGIEKKESGKSGSLFVTLALVAIAIPLAALLLLKLLR